MSRCCPLQVHQRANSDLARRARILPQSRLLIQENVFPARLGFTVRKGQQSQSSAPRVPTVQKDQNHQLTTPALEGHTIRNCHLL